MNRYLQQDHLAIEIARLYSNTLGKPFVAVVGSHEAWDIQSVSGDVSVEIKTDSSCQRTKNVAIEYWNTDYNKASGILSTHATTWLHLVMTEGEWLAIEYEVDVLRKLCIETGVVKSNGRNSLCKIIPLEDFKKCARRIFPFESAYLAGISVPQEGSLRRGGTLNQATSRAET